MIGDNMKNKELSKDYEKTKNFINFICSFLVFLLGMLFFIIPSVGSMETNKILFIVMLSYFGIKICEYILTRKSKDNEAIWIAIACILGAAGAVEYVELDSNLLVSVSLGTWVLILTIIKLIKINEYRDEENALMYLNIVSMSLFVLTGVMSIVSIYNNVINTNMVMGFFFLTNGILTIFETSIRIVKEKKKKGKKSRKL